MTVLSNLVAWQYRSGEDVLLGTGLHLRSEGDFAIVQGMGDREGQTIRVNLAHLSQVDRVDPKSSLSRFQMGIPTPEQMQLINGFLPQGAPDLTAADVVTIPFVAANNLVNRGLDCWDISSLEAMARLLPGLPALTDHDWESIEDIWGRIYSAELIIERSVDSRILGRAGQFENNRAIVQKHGFAQVVFQVFAPVDSPIVHRLRLGIGGNISTGGFRFTDYLCPYCSTSFRDEKCEHIPPDPGWGILPGLDESITEYAIRTGLYDMGEASLVVIPNLPAADII
jgi:hypothetical protein